MSNHIATATVHPAEPVIERPDVPVVGNCFACKHRGEQAIRIRYECDIECEGTEAETSHTVLACHRCEPMALDVIAGMENDL